jgi:DNA modification methylase
MKEQIKFEQVSIGKLVPYAKNSRVHTPEQINQIRGSVREFGFLMPCLIDQNFNIICGHGRIQAARAEGYTEVPCVIAEHLSDTQRRAFIIADNKLSENATWDSAMLGLEFTELSEMGFDLTLTGFDLSEIEKLYHSDGEAHDDDFNLSAALEKAAFVEIGDVWTLSGKHRLLCGDATKADDVERLMGGKKANLVVTDPPYNVSFESFSGLKIKNDSMKPEEFYSFLLSSFTNIAANLESGGSAYIFHADTEGENFRRAFREAGFHLSGTCIWSKDSLVMGRSPYQWKHEPILYGWLKSGTHKWYAGRAETTIWNFPKPKRNADHPTSKPIDLIAYPIKNSCQVNSIVIDTFLGSGSTLIACEQTDRICYGLELDTKYSSVILRRYRENYPDAEITVERNGQILQYADLVKEVEQKS